MDILEIAKQYATEKHCGQQRKNGCEYIIHPLAVGDLVRKYVPLENVDALVAAAYLHDVLEDTDATYEDIVAIFGTEISELVKELTSDDDAKDIIGKDKYLAYKLSEMSNWALVIKLCDRLHNISELGLLTNKDFIDRYINETKYIIDYIENHRPLTDIHQHIINDIKSTMEKYDDFGVESKLGMQKKIVNLS